jgi:4'-phosphopantetheinyl transferase
MPAPGQSITIAAVSMQLAPAEVHVWTAVPDQVGAPAARARCEAMLSADERDRMRRFHFERDRHIYLVAHALVRTALSRYATCAPAAWTFTANAHGRPEIAPGTCARPLRFNLSHTHGLVAVAVALERDVGVDVEHLYPRSFDLDVAEHFFAPAEVAALMAQPADAQRDRFFAYWTLKESYIKARGLGLALPLDQFAFDLDRRPEHHLDHGDEIVLTVDPRLEDDGRNWWFHQRRIAPEHRLAVALRRQPGEPIALQVAPLHPGDPGAAP